MSNSENDDEKKNYNWTFVIFVLNIIVLANTNREDFMSVFKENGETYYLCNQITTWGTLAFWVLSIFVACGLIGGEVSGSDNTMCILCSASILLFCSLAYLVVAIVFMCIIWSHDPEHTFLGYNKFWTEGATSFTTGPSLVNTSLHGRLLSSIPTTSNLRGLQSVAYTEIDTNLMNYTNTSIWPTHLGSQMVIGYHEYLDTNTILSSRRLEEVDGIKHWPYVMFDVLIRINSFGITLILSSAALALFGLGVGYLCGCCKDDKKSSKSPATFSTFAPTNGVSRNDFQTTTVSHGAKL